ncbi:MAG: hypothetical protein WC233_01945 [Sphaerochaeta sp.]|jgi:hypothetical protein|nr:hypothetical protein [Spirochaetales bacterium]
MKASFPMTIDGVPMSAITIATQDAQLPSYILGGEKAPSYLYDGKELTKWYWKSLSVVDGMRVLTFDPLDLFSFSELATTRRSAALDLTRALAKALTLCDEQFLDLSSGIIPLWRLWATEEGQILILSQDLADLFAAVADEQARYFNIASWVHHNIHAPFSLVDQMVSLLYYSAVGIPPFFDRDTREDGFRHLPLAYLHTELPPKTVSFIDQNLSLSLSKMRDASGNKRPQRALSYFLEQTQSLVWDLESRETVPVVEELLASDEAARFVTAQAKRAKHKVFWRKRGWLVISVTLSVLLVGGFITGRVKEAMAPPYTASFDERQLIEAYYQAQNELDLQKMEAALGKGVKNPFSMEVTNLFVTRQTRQAYESFSVQVNAQTWRDEGMPPIVEDSFIYGVSDLSIKDLGNSTYLAQGTYWAPFNHTDEGEAEAMGIWAYDLTQQFSIEIGKKGWLLFSAVGMPTIENGRKVAVPTVPRFVNSVQLPQ